LLKSVLLNFVGKIQEVFGFHHKKLTYIEGGLGSQILSVIYFYNQQEKYGNKNAKCDLSYFSREDRAGLWEWSLNNYGIHIDELMQYESRSRLNLLKSKKDFLTDLEISQKYWRNSREKYLSRFPIDVRQLQIFLQNFLQESNLENYGAIHIRRGDYLQVASRIIKSVEYIHFLEGIKTVLPNVLFIITDSLLTIAEKQELSQAIGVDRKAIFLDGPSYDPFVLHCLMRRAHLLVTSNSTFSFSAGLLGKEGQVVFSPLEYHAGKGSEKYNKTFRSVGSFISWDLDSSRGTI
jgi:hypothetical protein